MNEVKTFWWFVCERQQIYHRRYELNQEWPWTDDPILRDRHFTNVYRELDRGTLWFQNYVSTFKNVFKERALLWAAVAYRLINKVETFQEFGGLPMPSNVIPFMRFLAEERAKGKAIFTGRHQVRGLAGYANTLDWMLKHCDDLADELLQAEEVPQAISKLRTIPGVGAFFANQVYLDLLESGFFPNFTENDYIEIGPGAVAGMNIIFGKGWVSQERLRELVRRQREGFLSQGLDMPFYQGKELTCKNIEHALCEFSKWWRANNGGAKPGKRDPS